VFADDPQKAIQRDLPQPHAKTEKGEGMSGWGGN
jgi:hypothetical protein